jgi:peptide/nickel transport system substrate-binding protein
VGIPYQGAASLSIAPRTPGSVVAGLVYDYLVVPGERLVPRIDALAQIEESTGGRRLTLRLQRGIVFHDGGVAGAGDLLAALEADRARPFFANRYAALEKALIEGENVVLSFRRPDPAFTAALAWLSLERTSGPYRMVRGDDSSAELEANASYWNGPPHIRRVAFRAYGSLRETWGRLTRNEVDVDLQLPAALAPLVNERRYRIVEQPSLVYVGVAVNHRAAPFADARVRKALSYAAHRADVLVRATHGYGVPCFGPVPPEAAFHDGSARVDRDPQAASALLTAAGLRRGADGTWAGRLGALEFTLLAAADDDELMQTALVFQQQMASFGVRVRVEPAPLAALKDRLERRDFQALLATWNAGLDPGFTAMHWYSGEARNFWGYSNREVDAAYDAGRATTDFAGRREAYVRLQRAMIDDPPAIFLYWRKHLAAVHRRYTHVGTGYWDLVRSIPRWEIDPSYRDGAETEPAL